jgi:glycosyltransferase involved in cell wall biosynthesis
MSSRPRPAPAIRVSVVIPGYNSARHLEEALEAVLAQRWDGGWELVFADNGSTDGSWRTFEETRRRHPDAAMLGVEASQRPGRAHALNMAVAASRGAAIVVVDADDVPAPGWLRAMAEALQRHDFGAADADPDPDLRHASLTGPPAAGRPGAPVVGVRRLHYAPFAPCAAAATMGFTRRLFDAVGGFDPAFQAADVEFCVRAHLAGFALHSACGARVRRRARGDLPSIYRQARADSKCEVMIAHRYAHLGPPQRARWAGLAGLGALAVGRYLAWRLAPARRKAAHGAAAHWRLGVVAGQLAGIVAYRAPPSVGLPPRDAAPKALRAPRQQAV